MGDWVLLEADCIEDGAWPLIIRRGRYATAADAARAVEHPVDWLAHPQGGYAAEWDTGGYWIAPAAALAAYDGSHEQGGQGEGGAHRR